MLSRNLPLYQSSSEWPNSGHGAAAPAPHFGDGAFTELRRRRRREGGLFWLLVAALALGVGAATWLAMPAPKLAPAPIASSPNVLALPDRQRPTPPADRLTTAGLDRSGQAV